MSFHCLYAHEQNLADHRFAFSVFRVMNVNSQNCSQIPKLRMACAAGLNGQRTMWAHCEQCGAIEMVDFD